MNSPQTKSYTDGGNLQVANESPSLIEIPWVRTKLGTLFQPKTNKEVKR